MPALQTLTAARELGRMVGLFSPNMTTNFYDQTGEFVATFLPQEWEQHGSALRQALLGLDHNCGPVVDIGAGTGAGVRVVADALPAAEIVAVEPHRGLRTALLSAIAADQFLRSRVTVLDTDIFSAVLPETIGLVLAMNIIGHFSPAERQLLWALISERLASNGRAILNFLSAARLEQHGIPSTSEITLGRRCYRGIALTEPAGDGIVNLKMSYFIEENGTVIAEATASSPWHIFSPEQLASEIAEHGLQIKSIIEANDFYILSRKP